MPHSAKASYSATLSVKTVHTKSAYNNMCNEKYGNIYNSSKTTANITIVSE